MKDEMMSSALVRLISKARYYNVANDKGARRDLITMCNLLKHMGLSVEIEWADDGNVSSITMDYDGHVMTIWA